MAESKIAHLNDPYVYNYMNKRYVEIVTQYVEFYGTIFATCNHCDNFFYQIVKGYDETTPNNSIPGYECYKHDRGDGMCDIQIIFPDPYCHGTIILGGSLGGHPEYVLFY